MSGLQGCVHDWWHIRVQKHHETVSSVCIEHMPSHVTVSFVCTEPMPNHRLVIITCSSSYSILTMCISSCTDFIFSSLYLIKHWTYLHNPNWLGHAWSVWVSVVTHIPLTHCSRSYSSTLYGRGVEVTLFNVQGSSLLGHDTLFLGIFWHFKGLLPPSLGSFFLDCLNPQDNGSMFLWDTRNYSPKGTVSCPTRYESFDSKLPNHQW